MLGEQEGKVETVKKKRRWEGEVIKGIIKEEKKNDWNMAYEQTEKTIKDDSWNRNIVREAKERKE